jgi:hypothetical protein
MCALRNILLIDAHSVDPEPAKGLFSCIAQETEEVGADRVGLRVDEDGVAGGGWAPDVGEAGIGAGDGREAHFAFDVAIAG